MFLLSLFVQTLLVQSVRKFACTTSENMVVSLAGTRPARDTPYFRDLVLQKAALWLFAALAYRLS